MLLTINSGQESVFFYFIFCVKQMNNNYKLIYLIIKLYLLSIWDMNKWTYKFGISIEKAIILLYLKTSREDIRITNNSGLLK